jgi:hypothetical protein
LNFGIHVWTIILTRDLWYWRFFLLTMCFCSKNYLMNTKAWCVGESILELNHFKQKMMTHDKYNNVQWTFFGGNLFAILNSCKKLLYYAWQFFVKVSLDSIVELKGLSTFNVHIIYNIYFLTTMGCHIGWHVPFTNKKKWKNKTGPTSKIFPYFIWMFLSLKHSIIQLLWFTYIKKSCSWL